MEGTISCGVMGSSASPLRRCSYNYSCTTLTGTGFHLSMKRERALIANSCWYIFILYVEREGEREESLSSRKSKLSTAVPGM